MASLSITATVDQPSGSKSRTFKGHPQPPVNERLEEAKNFLADEDPNRCLGFREKLCEVEEYIRYIADENLDHDEGLLRAIKTMVKTHWDWNKRTQNNPANPFCLDAPSTVPVSLRLVSAKNAQLSQEEKEAMGIEAQMRDDHAPFTTSRGHDQIAFLKAMQKDSRIAPEYIDEKTNLPWVESRAYTRALQEPALIPYWLSPSKGLPNRGLKHGEEKSSYRAIDEQRRPPPQSLPDHLERRQQEINRLLGAGPKRTWKEQKKLEQILKPHQSHDLQARSIQYESRQRERDEKAQKHGSILFGGITDEEMRKAEQDLKKSQEKFQRGFRRWCRKFKEGVQLMVLQPGMIKTDHPGVFYFQPRETIPLEVYDKVQRAEKILHRIRMLRDGFRDLDVDEKRLLIDCVGGLADERALINYYDGLRQPEYHGHIHEQDLRYVNSLADIMFSDPMNAFARAYTTLKLLTPGEMDEETEGVCSLEYHPPVKDANAAEDTIIMNIEPQTEAGVAGGVDTVIDTMAAPAAASTDTEVSDSMDFNSKAEGRWLKRADLEFIRNQTGLVLDEDVASAHNPAPIDTEVNNSLDFSGKAERRGTQRAATELALNLLATNQEQHRSGDRFRSLELPQQHGPAQEEAPIALPIAPSRRPVETGSFQFTKRMMQFQQQKDSAYKIVRTHLIGEQPENIPPPANLNGPFTVASTEDKQDVTRGRKSHLARLCYLLLEAEKVAPRPLLQQMLLRTQEGINSRWNRDHPLWDEVKLRVEDTDLLFKLTAPSWDEDRKSYAELNLGLTPQQEVRLKEFESDVDEIRGVLPFWKTEDPKTRLLGEDDPEYELFQKAQHDPNQRGREGMGFNQFKQTLNTKRLGKGDINVRLWADEEVSKYLGIMRQANRIQFDRSRRDPQISRIPFCGHPENKFVTSRDGAEQSPGVRRNEVGQLEVQYDTAGTMGPPILQPNKYHHLQKLAFRVGRDMSTLLYRLAREHGDSGTYLVEQLEGMNGILSGMEDISRERPEGAADAATADGGESSLESLAIELNKIAPDLAQEVGIELRRDVNAMTASEAAPLIQIQMLEESNNNWESRFPRRENIWEFAAPRVEEAQKLMPKRTINSGLVVKQFFNMRKFPIPCQNPQTQAAIRAAGPKIEEKQESRTLAQAQRAKGRNWPAEVYRGEKQRPYFPFGETPYHQAFLNFRTQQDLKDVPEFQLNLKKRGLLSTILGATKGDEIAPYALPGLPKNWEPRSARPRGRTHSTTDVYGSLPGFGGSILETDPAHILAGPARNTQPQLLQKKRLASGPAGEQTVPKKTKLAPTRPAVIEVSSDGS